MPKYIVSFTEYSLYTLPVEAATKDEACKKAWDIAEAGDLVADCVDFDLTDDGAPNPEEVDDATFERFLGVAA